MTDRGQNDNTAINETPLQGWKEIAAYLERDVRTAQRWEASAGLPVRRHAGPGGSVYAYPSEIEAWRSPALASAEAAAEEPEPHTPSGIVRLATGLAVAAVIVAAFLVIQLGPILNPPSPVAEAAENSLRAELVWPEARGVSPQGSVSPDGRYVTYVDWGDSGNLAIRDLETGESRMLTTTADNSENYASNSRISPDGKQVVYTWSDGLRLLPLDGSQSEARTIWSPPQGGWAEIQDWLPDGQRIIATVSASDQTVDIVTLSLDGDELKQVRSIEWGPSPVVRVSPDGRYLAYSRSPARETGEKDIFLVAIDGSSESAVVEHAANDELVGWSPDGSHLLFNSDRSGEPGLWAQHFDRGAVAGEPFLVLPNVDVGQGTGIVRDGTLYYPVQVTRRRVKIAELDLKTGKLLRAPVDALERFVGSNLRAVFSPDGEKLAYVSERGGSNQMTVVVRLLATGEERDLHPGLTRVGKVIWNPDSDYLWVESRTDGLHRVDPTTGRTELVIAAGQNQLQQTVWTADGEHVYYRDYSQRVGQEVYVYNVADGSRGTASDFVGGVRFSLSPDGNWIASIHERRELRLRRGVSGEDRVLWSAGKEGDLGRWAEWTPDGQALVLLKRDPDEPDRNRWTIWVIPVDGSNPIETELTYQPANAGASPVSIHPDGRRVVYADGPSFHQFWALRNLSLALSETAAD